ncbi:MAG: hypothetical protein RJA22_2850 [Verrucomicrobiota bacterium]|jgi:uncharacterized Tic20 family protein
MSLPDELQRLQQLHASGALSAEEYAAAKARLLAGGSPPPMEGPARAASATDARQWAMYLHLSQLLGFVIPLAGFVAPIVIWQVKKDQIPGLDPHGRMVVNWMISAFIYALISGLLCFVLIGIPLLWALAVVGVVFPIIGGIKANNGELWNYPMTIRFLG